MGEAVGQDEPALGVGVVDLDRDAGLGAHDVAGLHRVAGRHVLGRADHARAPGPEARARAIAPTASSTAAPPDMSNFISCIFAAGLDRDPAGVEGHRLADEAEQRPGDVGRLVADRDQPRLLVEPRATAANAPIPAASIPARSSTSTVTPRSSAARAASAVGRHHVGRLFCRSRAALTASATTAARGRRRRSRRRARRGSAPRAPSSSAALLYSVKRVGGEQRALDERSRRARRPRDAGPPSTSVLRAELLRAADHGRRRHPRPLGVEVAARPPSPATM